MNALKCLNKTYVGMYECNTRRNIGVYEIICPYINFPTEIRER